jgi:hypothetical protein
MRARKIVYTFLTIFLLVIAFFATGILAPEYYEGEKREVFPDTEIDVWKNLTSLESIKDRKPDVVRIEVIEETRDGIVWIEHLKNGNKRTLRLGEREIPVFFSVEILQSDNGYTGKFEYFLYQNSETQSTEILIKEKSYNDNVVLRAWHTILGRNVNLRREVKSLRVSFFQRLLTTP